jgi:protocatechuate 3,4-dioxygenase, alpha subunit
MSCIATPSQTVGPFFHLGLDWLVQRDISQPGTAGERVTVAGRVIDGDGRPVPDALIEVWHADAEGRYPHPEDPRAGQVHPGFRGFGRVATDREGAFRFTSVKPGPVPGPDGRMQAPHWAVLVFMRGLLKHLFTRVYFPDEPANEQDPILALVEPARRGTLIARRGGSDPSALEWNVVLQGPDETVFFDV